MSTVIQHPDGCVKCFVNYSTMSCANHFQISSNNGLKCFPKHFPLSSIHYKNACMDQRYLSYILLVGSTDVFPLILFLYFFLKQIWLVYANTCRILHGRLRCANDSRFITLAVGVRNISSLPLHLFIFYRWNISCYTLYPFSYWWNMYHIWRMTYSLL